MVQDSQVQRILFYLRSLDMCLRSEWAKNVKEINSAGTERDISEGAQSDYPILTLPGP